MESVFDMGTLVFTPGASTLPQGPLSTSVEQLEHPVRHYSTKDASKGHFNAKLHHFGTMVKLWKVKKIKVKLKNICVG